MKRVGIIVVSYDNMEYLVPCIDSLIKTCLAPIYLVNNGSERFMDYFRGNQRITVLQQKDNVGWEGGLKRGMEVSSEELMLFLNDDTYFPTSSYGWMDKMVKHFDDPAVAAVGPSSNCVMGIQNIFLNGTPPVVPVNFLINFCCMVRRSALEDIGGIDDELPGGDDLDQSMRFLNKGYRMICDKTVFVYHHGFKTGERVHGGANVDGGWNSIQMMERTNFALINKHGLRAWMACMNQQGTYRKVIIP
jgi:GT2 family glycosyltransferase